ncbi:hypothetical protein [Thalassiella azotivora]
MSAFITDGDPDDVEEVRWFDAPDNEVPTTVPVSAVVSRTAEVAVVLTGFDVSSTGVRFSVTVHRRGRRDTAQPLLGEVLQGDPLTGRVGLLVGVETADGRRASSLAAWRPGPVVDGERALTLREDGGHSDARTARTTYWLSPVPPSGLLRVVVACPPLGLDEAVLELDATPLAEAAASVVELWPWEPPSDAGYEPAPPQLPEGSWFAEDG